MQPDVLRDQAAAEADGHGVCSTPRLELGEEMADVRLDRLLRQVEPLSDLPVDEPVGDELKNLELPGGRLLLELAQDGRRERDDGARARTAPARSRRFEAAAVVTITAEDLLTLRGVHQTRIGLRKGPL
jgi:hypothetical protein